MNSTQAAITPTPCPASNHLWPCHWKVAPCGRCSNHCNCHTVAPR